MTDAQTTTTDAATAPTGAADLDGERADLLETLALHRQFLLHTVRDLTDAQAAARPTASELCLGGLVKHVTRVERRWLDFIRRGAAAMPAFGDPATAADHAASFRMGERETLADLVAAYEEVGRDTAALVRTLPDLDVSHQLPVAPWYEPGTRWSARRVLLHLVAETAQHAGHADILRESIDGAKTMG